MTHPKKVRTAFDEYTIGKVIGEGGAGFVLEVTSRRGEPLALKYLRSASITTERQRRFKNEIEFCHRATHGNIIKVLDQGVIEPEGLPFYIMPRYAMTLRRFLEKKQTSFQQRLSVFLQILEGVEAAHIMGVAHRDLKPENVLLSATASEVVVADFGIASFIEAEMATAVETKDATRLANFKYAAPEQLEHAEPGDKRSDIFALGLMLNEAFTGKLARGSDYRRIAEVSSEFAYLDAVVEAMIKQDPDRRVPTLGQLKDEIAARSAIAVARQKLDAISGRVVPESEIDDPVVRTPPRVNVKDWRDNTLFFALSVPVPTQWRQLFATGWRSMPMHSTPDRAGWHGSSEFSVHATSQDAKQIQGLYEKHVEFTNTRYAEWARREHAEKLRRESAERQEAAKKEAERIRVLELLRQS